VILSKSRVHALDRGGLSETSLPMGMLGIVTSEEESFTAVTSRMITMAHGEPTATHRHREG